MYKMRVVVDGDEAEIVSVITYCGRWRRASGTVGEHKASTSHWAITQSIIPEYCLLNHGSKAVEIG